MNHILFLFVLYAGKVVEMVIAAESNFPAPNDAICILQSWIDKSWYLTVALILLKGILTNA